MSGGKSKSYQTWKGMRARCYNPNDEFYKNYGGRGIKICARWLESFAYFFADMGEPLKGCSLERKDNDGDYSPENCVWADMKTQARNRRGNTVLTYKGKTCTMTEHCEDAKINCYTVFDRYNKLGWTLEKALTTPVRVR